MKKNKKSYSRTVAIMLIIVMLAGMTGLFPSIGYGAELENINISVIDYNYTSGELKIGWSDSLVNYKTKSVRLSYHRPGTDEAAPYVITEDVANEALLTTCLISEAFEDNIMYDIFAEMLDINGNVIGKGFLYFTPRISFYAKNLNQEKQPLPGGGYETGVLPQLNLEWAMPKVWVNVSSSFVYVNSPDATTQIKNAMNDVNKQADIALVNFSINISTNKANLNAGSSQPSINIKQDTLQYTAAVAGTYTNVMVKDIDPNGKLNFNIMGRATKDTELPEAIESTLPYGDLLPGTVYYMNLKPVFKDSSDNNINILSVGKPEQQNGSYLIGATDYTYTPIRFQLTKDDADNIYVKIFKINQGSLDLPRLYYEVQISDDSSIPGDWPVKKAMDDTYFVGDYAINVLTGIHPSNLLYYKIVVKSDNILNRLESLPLGYQSGVDTGRPPVPLNLMVTNMVASSKSVSVPQTSEPFLVSSSNTTISWKKPQNWETIKNDLYFHLLLSTAQTSSDKNTDLILTESGTDDLYLGSYNTKYRLVKYVNALSSNILEEGDYLYYTIDAFDLFRVDKSDNDGISDVNLPNNDNYPTFLLPNKIYYLQMYTTKAENKGTTGETESEETNLSEKSVIISFTTLATKNVEVPLPKNLRLSLNDSYLDSEGKVLNKVEVQFDKPSINWEDYTKDVNADKLIYYDLYMSTNTDFDSFLRIGTSEGAAADVKFTGVLDPKSTSVKAEISSFSDLNIRAAFGDRLRPNSIYYFTVKTRLSVDDRQSSYTSILPVTTKSDHVNPPDPDEVIPCAPTDFDIARDNDGQSAVTGSEVTFNWTNDKNGTQYEIIATSTRLEPYALLEEYQNDYLYKSFKENLGIISLDSELEGITPNFNYDNESNICSYTIDRWLFPNRLYYFNIRAINKADNNKKSAWISIPVTTQITDAPYALEAVADCQLGFFWIDYSEGVRPEDYHVLVKGPSDKDYIVLDSSKASIVQDGNTFYGRLYALNPNTSYSIRVFKGANQSVLVYAASALTTRDGYHNLEVKWRGELSYKYELVIKAENDKDYTVLKDENLERYYDNTGKNNPYYLEETLATANSGTSYFYVKVKTMPVKFADGSIRNMALKSNTKYSVKVRAVKVDLLGLMQPAYSKYVGPVDVRTDFSQQDYDDTEQTDHEKGLFLDKIKELEEKLFWHLEMADTITQSYLLKGDRVANLLLNGTDKTLVFDFSIYNSKGNTDIVYIPKRVALAMNESNKSIKILTTGCEYILRPGMLDAANNDSLKMIHDITGVRDTYIEITLIRSEYSAQQFPSELTAVSKVAGIYFKAIGTSFTDDELAKNIEARLYGAENGIIKSKLDMLPLLHGYDKIAFEYYIKSFIAQIENEISFIIRNQIYYNTMAAIGISDFSKPLAVKISYKGNSGVSSPYVQYAGNTAWLKLPCDFEAGTTMSFNAYKSGSYAVLSVSIPSKDVPNSIWKNELPKLYSLYDFAGIFGSSKYLRPSSNVSVKEAVLVFEALSGALGTKEITSIKLKAEELGIQDIVNTHDTLRGVEKQEMASLAMRLYCEKTGSSLENLRAKSLININDKLEIERIHYKAIEMSLDLNLMSLENDSMFSPENIISRGELIAIIVSLLKITGEI